ncbi:MAG: methyltransferase, partial [Pseudomonadota bacterium]
SKALFAALHFDVFSHIAAGAGTAAEVGAAAGLHEERARTLLTALAGLGLIAIEGERVANAPAAEAFLVRGARYDFGDYLRFQIDRQMYGLMGQIEDALADRLPPEATASYAEWFKDPEAAATYSRSQHAGSLGPARSLARGVDLSAAKTLLDVGGGTGAFAITLAQAFPELHVTVVDFQNVAALGRDHVAEAGLSDRITYREGDGLEAAWPAGQDAILMSYLFSGVPGEAHPRLIARAFEHLAPGGRLMIHDFMVEAGRTGPKLAALWQLQHTAFTPQARSLDTGWLSSTLTEAGFAEVSVTPMIPGMTMLGTGVQG